MAEDAYGPTGGGTRQLRTSDTPRLFFNGRTPGIESEENARVEWTRTRHEQGESVGRDIEIPSQRSSRRRSRGKRR